MIEPSLPRSRRRRIFIGLIYLVLALVLVAGLGLALTWSRLGAASQGARLERIQRSPNYAKGRFQNPVPTDNTWGPAKLWQTMGLYLGGQKRVPDGPLPLVHPTPTDLASSPASGLRVTWLGHSTAMLDIDGVRILLDPVFSDRASPLSFIGPKRFHPVPVTVADLPALDAVVISHDHFDHLDFDSILQLAPKTPAFYVPLGLGAHLEYWGVPAEKIIEMDWWEEKNLVSDLRLVSCPARHFSGRMGLGNRTQWASWALLGREHRVFFSGDTGPMPLFARIGTLYGPFDATLIKIGAYGQTWPDIHLNPEQAVEVHQQVRGRVLIPIHWGTFNLSYHAWTEPVERLVLAAAKAGVTLAVPRPGQFVDPARPPALEQWWPEAPWKRPDEAL